MNPAALFLGIAVAVVIGGIAYGALSAPRFLAATDRVWLFGDSLGVGLLPRLQQQMPATVTGNPIGGTTIQRWAGDDATIGQAKQWGATVALVVLGTNDSAATGAYRLTVGQLALTLEQKLTAAGMRVWWLGPGNVPKFAQGSAEVQARIRLALTGTTAVVADPSGLPLNKQDGVHPDPAGYAALAGWIVDRMTG
jgi:lysophospholipase L1-like esterase